MCAVRSPAGLLRHSATHVVEVVAIPKANSDASRQQHNGGEPRSRPRQRRGPTHLRAARRVRSLRRPVAGRRARGPLRAAGWQRSPATASPPRRARAPPPPVSPGSPGEASTAAELTDFLAPFLGPLSGKSLAPPRPTAPHCPYARAWFPSAPAPVAHSIQDAWVKMWRASAPLSF